MRLKRLKKLWKKYFNLYGQHHNLNDLNRMLKIEHKIYKICGFADTM